MAILWNAKAGCTFASKWLWFQEGLLDEALSYSPWPHEYRLQVYCRRPAYPERMGRIPELGSRALKFVRDPFDRTVSAYLSFSNQAYRLGNNRQTSAAEEASLQFRRLLRHPRARSLGAVASDARQIYVRYRRERAVVLKAIGRYLGRPVGPGHPFTFREYVGYLGTLDLDRADPHIRRQISWCERLGQLPQLRIVRLEESASELPTIEDELGLRRSDLVRLRASRHHTSRRRSEEFAGDARIERTSDVEVPTTRSFYDDALIGQVADLYAEDFDAYGYPSQPRA